MARTATPVTLIREMHVERKPGRWTDDGYEDGPAYRLGDSEWYEPYTSERGRLFRSMQREYGRCVSAVYIDTKRQAARPIGWVFEKRRQYEDTGRHGRPAQFYVHEVWVELGPEALGEWL